MKPATSFQQQIQQLRERNMEIDVTKRMQRDAMDKLGKMMAQVKNKICRSFVVKKAKTPDFSRVFALYGGPTRTRT